MAFTFSHSTREILEQLVHTPRFKELTKIPLFAPQQILLLIAAYCVFGFTTYQYLVGNLIPLIMIIINAITIYVAFTPLHDATHRTVSSNRLVNDVLGTIACFALLPGVTTRIYRYLHLEHHRFTGNPAKDPDDHFVIAHPLLLPFILASPDISWSLWYLKNWNNRPALERLEFFLCISIYVGIHVYFLSSIYAAEFFLCWMIPQRIGMTLVTYFFAHIQHPPDVLWETAPFQTTVHIPCHWFFRALMLNQSEHCIHHLAPSVPYYRYHEAWKTGKHLFRNQNIPVRGFFTPAKTIILPEEIIEAWIEVKVNSVISIADNIKSFEFVPIEGQKLHSFKAGAHIDVKIDDGLVRQYSLTNNPLDLDRYIIGVKKEDPSRGGSSALHEKINTGDTIYISQPRNNFPLKLQSEKYFLIARGIGLTPLLSMAYELHNQGKFFELHLWASRRERLPFYNTLSDLPFSDFIKTHFDAPDDLNPDDPNTPSENRENNPLQKIMSEMDTKGELYVCGSNAFMSKVIDSARTLSWSEENIFSESFTPRERNIEKNQAFEVELAKSGKVLQVGENEFLLDVLSRAKAGIPCSCTQGICGSCITPVLSGELEHRDAILTESQRLSNKVMCVCVSRARGGRLVLDV